MVLLEKIMNGINLSLDEASGIMNDFLHNEISDVQKAAILTALKMKGETPVEIAGFARTMRDNAISLDNIPGNCIDVCGTGGDNSGSFNISTAVAFVCAAAGVNIAKHGNRSVSSKSGSADVLTTLGVKVDNSAEVTAELLNKTGMAFLFAPVYHPAMKNVAAVRKAMGVKTVFNMLGPLTNPARTKVQLIGTFNRKSAQIMAEASAFLDMERISFVCTDDRYDEVTLTGMADLYTYTKDEEVTHESYRPEDFGYNKISFSDIQGGNPEFNALILKEIFDAGARTPKTDVVCANSALAFKTAGIVSSIKEGAKMAESVLFSGKAKEKLEELKNFSGAYEKYS